MSKLLQTPTQKGTDLWPTTTQMPTRLVIKDVPRGSPLEAVVVDHFSGRLKSFHAKQQQNYGLSPVSTYRSRQEFIGGRATYVNQGGQEYLTLEVDRQLLRHLEKAIPSNWDYALVELFIPDMYVRNGSYSVDSLAQVTTPLREKLTPSSVWPAKGVAHVATYRDTLDLMVNAAGSTAPSVPRTPTRVEGCASYTVDLRPARGLSVVTLDLYGQVIVSHDLPTQGVYAAARTSNAAQTFPDNEYSTSYDNSPLNPGGNYAIYKTVDGDPVGYPEFPGVIIRVDTTTDGLSRVVKSFIAALPETRFDRATLKWVFVASGSEYYGSPLGGGTLFGPGRGPPTFEHWKVFTGALPSPLAYDGPSPIPAEVQVTVFKGVPQFIPGYYSINVSSYYLRWDYPNWPLRAGHSTVGRVGLSTQPNQSFLLSAFYGVPKLGTVSIDLRMGGASWKPA